MEGLFRFLHPQGELHLMIEDMGFEVAVANPALT